MVEKTNTSETIGHNDVVVEALRHAYETHITLKDGKNETGHKNIFGDQTFKADAVAGEAVLRSLKRSELPLRVSSEELEKPLDLSEDPEMLVLLDELDGSTPFKMGAGRYATMLALLNNLNPKYKDWVSTGLVDYNNDTILFALPGSGTRILYLNNNESNISSTSHVTRFDPEGTRVRADGYFDINRNLVEKLGINEDNLFVGNPDNGGASCQYYMDLTTGKVDVVIECTRKRNLEIAVSYGLVTEAGGSIVDINGDQLGEKYYLNFGQGEHERIPVISAATPELAKDVVSRLR